MLRNAKRAANIGKSSRYAESATSTPKSPIAMNSVLWLPRTPGHRPPQACLNTTAMANEPKNKKVAAPTGLRRCDPETGLWHCPGLSVHDL